MDLVAVEMEGDGVGEGDHGERHLGPGRHRAVERLHELIGAHAVPDVVVGDDQGALAAQVLVAAGVIAVPVGVEHEADRPGLDRRHRRLDLLGQRRELIVDQEHSVLAGRDPDVAPLPDQHVDARRHRHRLDDDLLRLLRRRG